MNRNFDIRVDPTQSKIIQKILFELGYHWADGQYTCINLDWKMLSIDTFNKCIQGSRSGDSRNYSLLLDFDEFMNRYKSNIVKYYSPEQMIKFAEYYVEHINDDISKEDLLKMFTKCI